MCIYYFRIPLAKSPVSLNLDLLGSHQCQIPEYSLAFSFQASKSHHLSLNHDLSPLPWKPSKKLKSSTYFSMSHLKQFSHSDNSIHMAFFHISLSSISHLCTFQVLDCHQHRLLVTGHKLVYNSMIGHFFMITLSKLERFQSTTVPKDVLESWYRASAACFQVVFV